MDWSHLDFITITTFKSARVPPASHNTFPNCFHPSIPLDNSYQNSLLHLSPMPSSPLSLSSLSADNLNSHFTQKIKAIKNKKNNNIATAPSTKSTHLPPSALYLPHLFLLLSGIGYVSVLLVKTAPCSETLHPIPLAF